MVAPAAAAGSITVAVRVRPPTSWEAGRLPEPCYESSYRGDGALSSPVKVANTSSLRDIVQVIDDRVLVFDPDEKDRSKAFVERGFLPPGTKRYKDKRLIFDSVYGGESVQQDVYGGTAQPLLGGLFNGYNATVFAYGATGCGKTHTISGTEGDPGIIYLTMADLFQRIDDRKDEWNVEVMVTFLEIYNEEIRDLLTETGAPRPRGGLNIREDKTVKVVGLVELRPTSAAEVKEIVLQGNLRRTQSPTHANATSSRSHAVLQVHVTQSPRTASLNEDRTLATLSIIDLAGSERAAATSNMGQRMVEGANINKSLLALGNCINALCESGGATRHVPYRNSKLTRLLKFALGGNSKTVMIVCVAPTSAHFDDTHNTLLYAERATKIKTKVVTRNVVNVDRHVGRYVEAINRLNMEVVELKARLAGKAGTESTALRRARAEAGVEVERAKNDMKVKSEQTQASIVDGATCAGKLAVSQAKIQAVQARLAQIDTLPTPWSTDVQAERALLVTLASPDEQLVRQESVLNARLQRSNNSGSMFDATLRAVSERRSDKLDEVSVDNVKMDAQWRRADMDRVKAEAERDTIRAAVQSQAEMVVNLVGMVGRCTVMISEASKMLRCAVEEGRDGMEGTVRAMSASLGRVAEQNDEAFTSLVGLSTASYADSGTPASLNNFKGHSTSFSRRTSIVGPGSLQRPDTTMMTRRTSIGSTTGRAYRSPRKSLRSIIAAPYRRAPEKELKKEKNVQWRDEAGRGKIDDRSFTLSVIPAPEANSSVSTASVASSVASASSSNLAASTSTLVPPRNVSMGGSESEWEDEKTEDSMNINFMSLSRDASAPRGGLGKRTNRLDPSFLKTRTPSALGSLAEDDETSSPIRRPSPLGDQSLNQTPERRRTSGGKTRDRHHLGHGQSPRRGHGQGTPRAAGTQNKSSSGGRRRSGIGAMVKGRRRSSLIPQLSPPNGTGAKRLVINSGASASPAKRSKRPSLKPMSAMRSKPVSFTGVPNLGGGVSGALSSAMMDPNASGDMSFKGPRPTWK